MKHNGHGEQRARPFYVNMQIEGNEETATRELALHEQRSTSRRAISLLSSKMLDSLQRPEGCDKNGPDDASCIKVHDLAVSKRRSAHVGVFIFGSAF